MQTARPTVVFLTHALALVGSGCSLVYGGDIDARQCKTQADCEPAALSLGYPLVCEANACVRPACTSSAECPTGTACVDAVCASADAGVAAVPCTQDSECGTGKLCGFDKLCYEKWGCLDQDRDWLGADANATYRAAVRRFENVTDPAVVGDLTVVACGSSNPSCSPPFVASKDVTVSATKEIGVPFRNLPANGFIGSVNVAVTGAAAPDGGVPSVVPAYVHFTSENPLVSDLTAQTEVFIVGPDVFTFLGASWGVSADVTKATMVLQVHDCGGRKAAGVSIGPTGETGYLFVPVTGKSTPVLGGATTTEDGAALVLNLPAKSLVFTLRDEEQGRILSDRISINMRGTALNYLVYYPRRSAVERWMAHARSSGLSP